MVMKQVKRAKLAIVEGWFPGWEKQIVPKEINWNYSCSDIVWCSTDKSEVRFSFCSKESFSNERPQSRILLVLLYFALSLILKTRAVYLSNSTPSNNLLLGRSRFLCLRLWQLLSFVSSCYFPFLYLAIIMVKFMHINIKGQSFL